VETRRIIFILDARPPKLSDNRGDFGNKFIGEKNGGHVINRDGGKNRVDISQPTHTIQFVGFEHGEFGFEFIDDKVVSLGAISMVKNQGMPKVDVIGMKILNRKDALNNNLTMVVNISTKDDGRLAQVRGLTRGSIEALKNGVNFGGLIMSGLPANDKIINKKEGMDARTIGAQCDAMNVVGGRIQLKTNGKLINSQNEKVRRKRTTLCDTTIWVEARTWFTIYDHQHCGCGNT